MEQESSGEGLDGEVWGERLWDEMLGYQPQADLESHLAALFP